MDWKIYFSLYKGPEEVNFYTFSSEDGSWEEAPQYGVLTILTMDPSHFWGRLMLQNYEVYYKVPERGIMFSKSVEMVRIHVPGILENQIKYGGNAFGQDWVKVIDAAAHDTDFPRGKPRRRVTDWPPGSERKAV